MGFRLKGLLLLSPSQSMIQAAELDAAAIPAMFVLQEWVWYMLWVWKRKHQLFSDVFPVSKSEVDASWRLTYLESTCCDALLSFRTFLGWRFIGRHLCKDKDEMSWSMEAPELKVGRNVIDGLLSPLFILISGMYRYVFLDVNLVFPEIAGQLSQLYTLQTCLLCGFRSFRSAGFACGASGAWTYRSFVRHYLWDAGKV